MTTTPLPRNTQATDPRLFQLIRPPGQGSAAPARDHSVTIPQSDVAVPYMQEDSIEPEEEVMHLTVARVLAKVLLFAITAVATHLVMSFSQTL
jgi:hypothetical protein